jgi:hydroxymethylpyrimidine pyrophosphatase-like HAD family hydrolase
VFNKSAVMVLPSNVNKASGLRIALERLSILPDQAVGVGDAENDHAFLEICGIAVAVDNALPALKARCDLATTGDHGRGVQELIARLLADELKGVERRQHRPAPTGQ